METVSTLRLELALLIEFITGIVTVLSASYGQFYPLFTIIVGALLASYTAGIFNQS